ncbi:MAG: hypothetical protein LBD53_09375 [Tannerella sp.]|jgi:hypothetical protein|nr:hypothetical protein [Tannerella sp.]
MAKILTIYCEGKKGSHDFDILEKIVGDMAVTIKPIGGKRGANAIIGFSEMGTVQSDYYLFFRDRDFDCSVSEKEELTIDKNTHFSHRTTIENYLFDVKIFYQFLVENKFKDKYNLRSEDEVKDFFIEIAKDIKYYQAVRHTLGQLRFPNSFDTTWTDGSGYLPAKLDLDACKTEAWKLISDVVSRTNKDWTKDKFDSTLESFLKLFDEKFFNDLKFLIYFQGKDFAKVLTNKLSDFPLKDYYKYAKKNFNYTKYADLVQLREIIRKNFMS